MKRSICILLIFCFFILPFAVAADENEPPTNRFLAASPWAMSHRNSYCQASSPYPDGNRALWASAPTKVVKIDPNGKHWEYVDKFDKGTITLDSLATLSTEDGLTGAYTLLDKDNIF